MAVEQQDINIARFAWDIVQTLLMLGVSLYVYINNKSKVNTERIEQLEYKSDENLKKSEEVQNKRLEKLIDSVDRKLEELSERVTRAEERLKRGPTHDDLANIFQRLNGVSREMSEMKGEFTGVKENLKRIHQFLLDNGVK